MANGPKRNPELNKENSGGSEIRGNYPRSSKRKGEWSKDEKEEKEEKESGIVENEKTDENIGADDAMEGGKNWLEK